jgi:N-hydroxyarylamine O-acetyltransferase
MSAPDLDAYFQRIGYDGPLEPSLSVLNGIVAAHARSIPFENLDVLLGRGIALDPIALQQKLVLNRRGGYCFEQNGFLLRVLETLGFNVRPISARVRIGRPRDFTPPRTHLFLRVELDGASWLADVGIGALTPTAAFRLELDIEQETLHETRRVIRENNRYFHQARLGAEWVDVCEFTLEEMPLIDRELANWYTSAHPQSFFKGHLTAARAGHAGTRVTLLNTEFTFRQADGSGDKTRLHSDKELSDVLSEHFELHLDADDVRVLYAAALRGAEEAEALRN